jgi:hypothetical protein
MIRFMMGQQTKTRFMALSLVRYTDLVKSDVSDAIRGVYDGYNSTVFAYGQTGSGKTFTMFGDSWEEKVILSKKKTKAARLKIMD